MLRTQTKQKARVAPRSGLARRHVTILSFVFTLVLAACGGSGNVGTNTRDSDAETEEASEVKAGVKPEADGEVAVIEMENPAYCPIIIELYPNIAPQMVERFKTLTREGFYNGTAFHRIGPPSQENPGGANVIQGGDPNSKDDDLLNDGGGESSYPDLARELSDLPFEAGTVGAARQNVPVDSANSQFFILLGPNPDWEGQYTAFGKVIRGLNCAAIINGAPTKPGSSIPEQKIVVKSIRLEPRANY